MTKFRSLRLASSLLVLTCFGLSAGWGQQAGGPPVKRVVYQVKHGLAGDLAVLLGKVYKAEPRVQALAAPSGNALVIGAPADTLDEVLGLLKRLDRGPRSVAIEVILAKVPAARAEGGKPAPPGKELDEREFTGNAEDALAKLQNLQARGLIAGLKRFRLTAAENRPAALLLGENQPTTSGVAGGLGGKTARSILYRNVGTSIRATARLGEGNQIVLDYHIDNSRLRTPEDGVALGVGDKGEPVRAAEVAMTTAEGQVTLPSGDAAVVSGLKAQSRLGRQQTLILITARLLEP
jgi:type II secretory pathway component GspD/PulD (secretin)